jgi:hypothetical protein
VRKVRGAASHFHRNFFNTFVRFGFLDRFGIPKPEDGFLELAECADLPAVKAAQEREETRAMMRIARIKDSQALLSSESDFVERADESGKILDRQGRFGALMKRTHINQGAVHAALSASPRNFGQNFPARLQIHATPGAESDEFAGPNDL